MTTKSRKISKKVKKLIKEGYGRRQAVAIAYNYYDKGCLGPRGGLKSRCRKKSRKKSRKKKYNMHSNDFTESFINRYEGGHDFRLGNGDIYKIQLYQNHYHQTLYDLVKAHLEILPHNEIIILRKCFKKGGLSSDINFMIQQNDILCNEKHSINKPEMGDNFNPETDYINVTNSFLVRHKYNLSYEEQARRVRGEYQNVDQFLVIIYNPEEDDVGMSREEIEAIKNRPKPAKNTRKQQQQQRLRDIERRRKSQQRQRNKGGKRKKSKYRMRSLKALASNTIANRLGGNIDQRMATAMTLDIPELARRNIIHELERDRELISEFYNAVNVKEKIQHLNFYILQNNFEKVRTVFKYYPEKLNLPDTNNTTPLMMAAEHDLTGSIVEQLLTIGIDDSSQRLTNSIGETAFLIATLVVNVKALKVFRTHPKSVWYNPSLVR